LVTENRKQSLSEPSQAEPAEGAGIDRRTFIKRAGAAGVAFAAAATAGSVAPTALGRALNRRSKPLVPRHRIGIGTEVYAFSLQPPADVYTKLDEIRQIGYRAVELIEFNGFPGGISRAREVRRLLQKAGLRGVGNFHLTYATPNNIRNALEMLTAEDKAAGMIDFGMVAAEHDPSWQNEAKYRELAQDFNTWGEITRKAGLRFYVHNEDWVHDRDPTTGKHLYDIWIEETDPDLVFFNLDTFQLAYRGFDPVEYVERLEADDRITHFQH
jgi:sugar phosphate isomerase/epimerase